MQTQFSLDLLHLADSALPVGSFAYSAGLECCAKMGHLSDIGDLQEHLDSVADNILSFDLPFMVSLCDERLIKEAWETYHLHQRLPQIREASLTQGRAWLRLAASLYPELKLGELRFWMREQGLKPHFIPVMTSILHRKGWSSLSMLDFHIFCTVRDQVSAAIRLGLVGPTAGHSILAKFLQNWRGPEEVSQLSYLHAYRCCPVLDIAQAHHASLYSKQFKT